MRGWRWACGHMGEGWKRYSPFAIVGMVLGGIVLAVGLAFLFGWVVMLLWNWLMPEIFGLPRIGYWQGWGLVLLSHILLKSSHAGGGGRHGDRRGKRDGWRAEARMHFSDRGKERDKDDAAKGESGAGEHRDEEEGSFE